MVVFYLTPLTPVLDTSLRRNRLFTKLSRTVKLWMRIWQAEKVTSWGRRSPRIQQVEKVTSWGRRSPNDQLGKEVTKNTAG